MPILINEVVIQGVPEPRTGGSAASTDSTGGAGAAVPSTATQRGGGTGNLSSFITVRRTRALRLRVRAT